MMTAAQIVGQLTAECMPPLNFVGGAGSLPLLEDQLKKTCSAFVMPPVEKVQPNSTGTQVTRQRSTIALRIMLGFIVRSATGIDQMGDVDTVREAVKSCLIGWTPDPTAGGFAPIGMVGFNAVSGSKDGMNIYFAIDFYSSYYVRAPQP
jgi:hypothetical protein